MLSSVIFLLGLLTTVVRAHFHLQFPPPRGAFVAAQEVNFCDGYSTPAANRTQFPLSDGYVTLAVGHGDTWTAGILVSTSQNPTRWEDFVLDNGYASSGKPGNFCIPLDFSKSNVTGLSAGQNITIQFVWNGGDGNLYQCADLTLASSLNLSSTVACQNVTATPTSSAAQSATASTSTKTSSGTPNTAKSIMFLTTLVALAGLLFL